MPAFDAFMYFNLESFFLTVLWPVNQLVLTLTYENVVRTWMWRTLGLRLVGLILGEEWRAWLEQ